jgi:heat shock protein HspQ
VLQVDAELAAPSACVHCDFDCAWIALALARSMLTFVGMKPRSAKFGIGTVVKHRLYAFRGVVFDIDPEFANTEEWWNSIPAEVRPSKDQPFYHLLAENSDTEYMAYVSEQNLLPDESAEPLRHPQVAEYFTKLNDGRLQAKTLNMH